MKKWVLIGCILSLLIILLPSVISIDSSTKVNTPDRVKFLVVGFFPETRQDMVFYYLIPGILWGQILYSKVTIIWLGSLFILGISDVRPNYWLGKIPA
jgi:hypothetical protein